MPTYIALLRAVNVGRSGKLLMPDLVAICRDAGFARVATYIASGNVVFESPAAPAKVKAALEARLKAHAGRPVGVILRTAAELRAALNANPFAGAEPKLTSVIFLDAPPPRDALDRVSGRRDEDLRLGRREIFVYYPGGMGRSRLKIPAAAAGTARNLNTVTKLAAMAVEA